MHIIGTIFFKYLLTINAETSDLTKYLQTDAEYAIDNILNSDREKVVSQQILPSRFHYNQVQLLSFFKPYFSRLDIMPRNTNMCKTSYKALHFI